MIGIKRQHFFTTKITLYKQNSTCSLLPSRLGARTRTIGSSSASKATRLRFRCQTGGQLGHQMAFKFAAWFAGTESSNWATAVGIRRLGEGYPDADNRVRAFLNLLCKRWFSRRWVIQEAVLPEVERVRVVCGNRGMSWRALSNTVRRMAEHIELFPEPLHEFFKVHGINCANLIAIRQLC